MRVAHMNDTNCANIGTILSIYFQSSSTDIWDISHWDLSHITRHEATHVFMIHTDTPFWKPVHIVRKCNGCEEGLPLSFWLSLVGCTLSIWLGASSSALSLSASQEKYLDKDWQIHKSLCNNMQHKTSFQSKRWIYFLRSQAINRL